MLDGGVEVVLTAPNDSIQREMIKRLAGIGDRLAFARLKLGEAPLAMRAIGQGRAIMLQAATAAERLAGSDALAVRCRLALVDWRQACVAADAAQDRVAAALGKSPDQLNLAMASMEVANAAVREAHEELQAALFKAGLDTPAAPAPAQVATAIPEGGVLMGLVVSAEGGAILLQSHGQKEPIVVDLPELNQEVLRSFVTGKDGWFKAYTRFRSSVQSPDGVPHREIEVWNAAVGSALTQLWNLVMGPFDARLRELGLISGDQTDVPAEVVLLVPGLLSVLPIHAARRSVNGTWRYFLEDWAVSQIPTLQTLVDCHRRSAEPARQLRRLLAVTNPTEDLCRDGTPIFDNPAWPLFGAESRRALTGREASVTRIEEAFAPRDVAGWSHLSFYCHGRWDPVRPNNSALIMANGEPLSMGRLRHLDLSASRLAILGACESGLVDLKDLPDELLGLPTGLVEAGVPAVISSLWLVEAQVTYDLVARVVQLHLDGLSPAQALRKAQVEILRPGHVEFLIPPEETGKTPHMALQAAFAKSSVGGGIFRCFPT